MLNVILILNFKSSHKTPSTNCYGVPLCRKTV